MVVTYSKVRYFKGAAHRIKKLHLENPCKTCPTTGGSVKSVPIAIGIRVLFQFIKLPPPSPKLPNTPSLIPRVFIHRQLSHLINHHAWETKLLINPA